MDGSDKQLSLYDRLGEEAIERAVYLFYDKVLADDRVRHFFKNVNTAILAQHQYNFLLTVTGGPGAYTGRTLRDAHRKLVLKYGLNDNHFDVIVELLKKTLEELGVGYSTIEELLGIVESVRGEVLNR
ncbi:MAG: group 1 truncated hemoglobin [Alphaproteobacteria bacterium]|jgi:hemoglobin|nr:group 1 truncated hemoglobin [Alphaproteobacteria bacterium]